MDDYAIGTIKLALEEFIHVCETAADLAGETDALTKRWNNAEEIMNQLDDKDSKLLQKLQNK